MHTEQYVVRLTRLVPFEMLDDDDKITWGFRGMQEFTAPLSTDSVEEALDFFHLNYPISMLEHFDIDVYLEDRK